MTRRAFTQEKSNLGRGEVSVALSRNREYSDIDCTLAVKTGGDIFKKINAAAVKQALKNLVMTNTFEKPFQPQFGANLRGLLFELADEGTDYFVIERLKRIIETQEPRASILDITVSNGLGIRNHIAITITFKVMNYQQTFSLSVNLERLR